MKVLVCGSRHFNDYDKLKKVLDGQGKIDRIIHGMARGADALGAKYAEEAAIDVQGFPALWEEYGKRAGYIRNARMLSEGQPDIVVAFLSHVGYQEIFFGLSDSQYNRGTKNMIKLAMKAGVPVLVIDI